MKLSPFPSTVPFILSGLSCVDAEVSGKFTSQLRKGLLQLLVLQMWTHMAVSRTKLFGFSPRTNYTDQATTACWRS
jgi:hypothetical protein